MSHRVECQAKFGSPQVQVPSSATRKRWWPRSSSAVLKPTHSKSIKLPSRATATRAKFGGTDTAPTYDA